MHVTTYILEWLFPIWYLTWKCQVFKFHKKCMWYSTTIVSVNLQKMLTWFHNAFANVLQIKFLVSLLIMFWFLVWQSCMWPYATSLTVREVLIAIVCMWSHYEMGKFGRYVDKFLLGDYPHQDIAENCQNARAEELLLSDYPYQEIAENS